MVRPSLTWIALCLCLVLSGMASLVYELIWIRKLTLVFGGTLYAISAVLCSFMAGLAVGSWALARAMTAWALRGKRINLILLYGIMEGLIGAYALFFPVGQGWIENLYPSLLQNTGGTGALLHAAEFFLAFLLILPPTLLMGATLPVIGAWAIGGEAGKVVPRLSLLYSLNTFGAVAGCVFTQFFAIKTFGVQGTLIWAVAVNFLVLVLCLVFCKRASSGKDTPDYAHPADLGDADETEPVPSKPLSMLLLGLFVYSGLVSLSSEILWTRVLVFPMGSALYSFALILATFLLGIALGSLVADKLLGNSRWIVKFLCIELAIGIACIAILPLFDRLPAWTHWADTLFYDEANTPMRTLWVRSLFAFGLMFLPTLGFGLLFPLANRIHLQQFGSVARTLGNCYALNTLGAVAGTVLTPFVFIPLFGIRLSLFVLHGTLIVLSIFALTLCFRPSSRGLAVAGLGSLAILVAGFFYAHPIVTTDRLGDGNLARTEITEQGALRLLDYKEGDFSTLSVVENTESGARTLYVNGFSTATVSQRFDGAGYMQAMGFVPMALHPNPKDALVICFGTGNTLGTAALFPGAQVEGVEIDRNVLSMARWFSKWNRDVLKRPNTHMNIQDGRTFLRWTEKSYDVITLEPMSPAQAGVVNLYSKEFYEAASQRLKPGGLMMQWLPLHLVSPEDARAIIQTFQDVFPEVTVWNSFLTRIVLLVGSKQPFELDRERFRELMKNETLRELAQEIGIRSFLDFSDFYLTEGKRLKAYLEGAPVITDDRPLLEFSPVTVLPPMKWETDQSFLNILRHRIDRFPKVTGMTAFEKAHWQRNYTLRTAQRLSIFAQRYHGPGAQAFAKRDFHQGLEAVRQALKEGKTIKLDGAQWDD